MEGCDGVFVSQCGRLCDLLEGCRYARFSVCVCFCVESYRQAQGLCCSVLLFLLE